MSEKTFMRVMTVVAVLGMISIVAMVVWSWVLYKDCSIISYIANKG